MYCEDPILLHIRIEAAVEDLEVGGGVVGGAEDLTIAEDDIEVERHLSARGVDAPSSRSTPVPASKFARPRKE